MNPAVDRWIDAHKEELIADLKANLAFRSLKDDATAGPGAPFGKEVRACLDHALEAADRLGFATKNLDGYCGVVDMPGSEGAGQIGAICHLDVVPEGTGWTYPPYGGEIHDGKLYARGTMDDKGPAFAVLYAMKAIKECGLPLKRSVRLILGCDEESGMACLEHYNKVEKAPDMSFSPDAEYPLVNSEKLIFRTDYKKEYDSAVSVQAGTRPNVVPGEATAVVPLALNRILPIMEAMMESSEFSCAAEAVNGESSKIVMTGLSAHASTPEVGKNALLALLNLLDKLPLPEKDAQTVAGLVKALGMDMHGEGFGLDITDASGRLTLNPGVMDWDETGIHRLTFDIRAPISAKGEEIRDKLLAGLKDSGVEQYHITWSDGYYISPEHELVKKLLDVYARRTGTRLEPLAIGGGTYARHMQNAVAFGVERPGEPGRAHMPNEYIPVDCLMEDTKMMADALIALAVDC